MNRTWLRIQSRLHSWVYERTNGCLGSQFGAPVLLITTVGRKSGKQRTNPLYYLVSDGHLVNGQQQWYVVASNAGSERSPAWWLNLQANPVAHIQVESNQLQVTGREVTEAERARLWPQFVALFAGYETYQQEAERVFAIVVLEPVKKDSVG